MIDQAGTQIKGVGGEEGEQKKSDLKKLPKQIADFKFNKVFKVIKQVLNFYEVKNKVSYCAETIGKELTETVNSQR